MRPVARFLIAAPAALLAGGVWADTPPQARAVATYAEQLLADIPANGPGLAVLVARGDEVLYRGARGMASIELGVPLSPDHVFRIGSVTKQIAAAGLLTLVDEGKVSLDDPISRFLPEYPNGDAITVTQLLNHTSGIQSYTSIPGYMLQDIRRDLDTPALIDVFKDMPAPFAPGTDWSYNNSGYILVGAVIEKASGKPWSAHLDEALFKPLQLTHTRDGAGQAIIAGHASGYSSDDSGTIQAGMLSMTQPHAAGALVSTVDDLVRWNRALHGGRVLAPATYQRMITPEGQAAEQQRNYGFGIERRSVRNRVAYQHGGGIHGFVSLLVYLPDSGISVAVLRNTDGEGTDVGLLTRRLAAFALGDPYPAIKPVTLPEAELKAIEGIYRKDAETRTLRLVDGALTSQRSGGRPYALVATGNDHFAFAEDSLSRIDLVRDDSGAITALRMFPEGEGTGDVWTRTDEPLTERARLDLPRAALERLVGDYVSDQFGFTVSLDDAGILRVQVPGQAALQLYAASPTQFYVTEVDANFDFAPADGAVETCTTVQGSTRIVLTRKAP